MKRFVALLEAESRLSTSPTSFDYEGDAKRRQQEREAFIAAEIATLSRISQILIGGAELCSPSL